MKVFEMHLVSAVARFLVMKICVNTTIYNRIFSLMLSVPIKDEGTRVRSAGS